MLYRHVGRRTKATELHLRPTGSSRMIMNWHFTPSRRIVFSLALLFPLCTLGCRIPCLRGPQAGAELPQHYAWNNGKSYWGLQHAEMDGTVGTDNRQTQPDFASRSDAPEPDARKLPPVRTRQDDRSDVHQASDNSSTRVTAVSYQTPGQTESRFELDGQNLDGRVGSPPDSDSMRIPVEMGDVDSATLQTATQLPAFSYENSAQLPHEAFFEDPYLLGLIQQSLAGNQELKILSEEIRIACNEVYARSGEYRPFVSLGLGAGVEKPGEHTRAGAVEQQLEVVPGRDFPEPLPDFLVAADISWEVDIWKRLRNAQRSAAMRYLGTREGRNFVVTRLVAEIAENYYELLALDSRRSTLDATIEIQMKSLEAARAKKAAGRGTELAVQRFQAEVAKNQSEQSILSQEIVEVENRINFLVGRFPQRVERTNSEFVELNLSVLSAGVPSQLLQNRADIRQAEREVAAAGLDVLVARGRFYPSLSLSAGVGWNAFSTGYLFRSPESLIYGVASEIVGPLINRRAIKAAYCNANAAQLQAIYNYQQTILEAHIEVVNHITKIENYRRSIEDKKGQLNALDASVVAASKLFQNARAEYVEVLLAQREYMEARMQLIDTKRAQLCAIVNAYQALGGGAF